MIKMRFGRVLVIPLKQNQRIFYISDSGNVMEGIVHSVDISFLDSGKAADVDFIVHPITENGEELTAEIFSDFEINSRVFKKMRKAKRTVAARG